MIWIFTILGEILFGCEITFFILVNKVDFFVQCAIGTIIGIGLSTLIFFGCSAILGITSFHILMHTIVISALAYSLMTRRFLKKKFMIRSPTKNQIIFFIVSMLISLAIIPKNYLYKPFYLQENISDGISEEISIMNSFYHGVNSGLLNIFKIRHPSCYQCTCRSRWITALNSAMLQIGYSSIHQSLAIPSIIITTSFIFIYLNFADLFLNSVFCSLISLLIFFFAGGLGFKNLLYKEVRKKQKLDFIQDTGFFQTHWCHPLLQYILPSRPSQFSLGIVISILYLLTICLKQVMKRREMAMIGILFGLLPGTQFQVFQTISIYLIICFILHFDFHFDQKKRSKEQMFGLAIFFIAFLCTSLLQFLQFIVPRNTNANILIKQPIYLHLIQKGFFFPTVKFWFDALGIFPVFSLFLSWFVIDAQLMKLYIPSVIVFIWANNTLFQQIDYMNITVFYPCWMILASVVYIETLKRLIFLPKSEELQGFLFGISIFLVFMNVASGIYGYSSLKNNFDKKWSLFEEEAAKWIAKNTPKKAVFISSSDRYDVVSTLAGKVQFLHSRSLCHLYGFNDLNRTLEIQKLLNESDSKIFALKVEYIVNTDKGIDRQISHWGKGNWTKEFANREVTIFKRNLVRKKKKKLS